MNPALPPVKCATRLLEALLLAAVAWVLVGYIWPTLSNVEVATLQALAKPGLMSRDFAVQENLRFTPRFYFNGLVLLGTRAGLPLWASFLAWHAIFLTIIMAGLRSAMAALELSATASAILFLWIFAVGAGTLGLVTFYTYAPTPAAWAIGGVAWGIAFSVRGRWRAAYACFAAAVLLQFLVGLYAGLLFLPALIRDQGRSSLKSVAAWVLGLALVYLPMRMVGATSSEAISPSDFIDIYARLRLPHHLVPSTWGWPVWVQAASFYVGATLLLHRTARGRPDREFAFTTVIVVLVVAALALNFAGIEAFQWALIAKLQPARVTPLAQVIVLGLLATRLQDKLRQKEWLQAALLALIPLSPVPGFLLIAAALLEPREASPQSPMFKGVMALAVILAYQPFSGALLARSLHYGIWAVLAAGCFCALALVRRPRVLAVAAACGLAVAACITYESTRPGWRPWLPLHLSPNSGPSDPAGILGARFKAASSPDCVVLIPPSGETWTFKLYAERAVVVDDKNTPFSDKGLLEWKKRMDAVLGVPVTPELDTVQAWSRRSARDLAAVARAYGARYVLSRDAWHPSFPGRRIDQEQGWSLWRLD